MNKAEAVFEAMTQRRWAYHEPTFGNEDIIQVWTEAEIMRDYYPWWCKEMDKAGKNGLISKENCIEDWITVNWAYEIV